MIIEHLKIDLDDKMIFERAKLKPPLHIPNHMPNEACFLYVLNGKQEVTGEMDSTEINTDEAVLMKCGMFYSDWVPSDSDEVYEAFAVHFYPELLKELYDREIPDFLKDVKKEHRNVTLGRVKSDELIRNYVESMMFYFKNPDLVSDELIKLKIKELLLLLLRTENGNEIQHLVSSLFTPHEFSFKEIVNANLYRDVSIDNLAELTNLSVSTFKRKFGELYDDSPARYIKTKKLERAAELLKVSDKRISTIAYECGFNDIAHFSKSFQDKYHTSPSKYRVDPN